MVIEKRKEFESPWLPTVCHQLATNETAYKMKIVQIEWCTHSCLTHSWTPAFEHGVRQNLGFNEDPSTSRMWRVGANNICWRQLRFASSCRIWLKIRTRDAYWTCCEAAFYFGDLGWGDESPESDLPGPRSPQVARANSAEEPVHTETGIVSRVDSHVSTFYFGFTRPASFQRFC